MGYRVAALSSDVTKKELAHKLGAHYFIDTSNVENGMKELLKLG